MSKHTFVLNGKKVSVNTESNVRMLWVLRDILGVTGPKYGCGIRVCQACTSHLNGKHFNPCSVPISDIKASDKVTTIEGLAKTWKGKTTSGLHPVQEAWIKYDVAQCGYCQPGQVMAATALINRVKKTGRKISEADLDTLRNVCRCGSYPRIRQAVKEAASKM
jgi:isoquinoline 1-oxidoreductase alpha subunit